MSVLSPPLRCVPGCPQSGWAWLRCTDLREDEGLTFGDYEDCEFCGREQIRFVHEIEHADWPTLVRVGCVCAAHYTRLSIRDVAARERVVRNRSDRRRRFPTHRSWRIPAQGYPWISYRGIHIVVLPSTTGFFLRIDGQFGKQRFRDLRAAKLRAFDVVSRREDRVSQGSPK
jgi:hypothetical protein